jgi:hypothetical protein
MANHTLHVLLAIILLLRSLGQTRAMDPPKPGNSLPIDLMRFLEGFRALGAETSPVRTEALDSHVLFREVGYLAGTVAYGHILFTLNLTEEDVLLSNLKVMFR